MTETTPRIESLAHFRNFATRPRRLRVYAKRAQNYEAERKAGEIRIRAERRAGELLRELNNLEGIILSLRL
jgi:hypothetical protein